MIRLESKNREREMNRKQIEAQIEKLTKKKEDTENKKREAIQKFDADIKAIDADISNFRKVLDQLSKLEKATAEQMQLAANLLNKKGS